MKRVVILVTTLLTLFSACQKEPKVSGIGIDVSAMYTELNILDDVRAQLNSESGVIVDSVFVYSESGVLMTRTGVESSTLNSAPLNIQGLGDGHYTLVVLQYLNSTNGQTVWYTTDYTELSNMSVRHKDVLIDGIYALGVATETITVQNGLCERTIIPKAAGSVMDFQLEDYSNSLSDGIPDNNHLPTIWLYGSSNCSGLYPGRDDTSRWIIQPDSSEIIGSMEEGQSQKKYFTLMNGDGLTVSVRIVSEDGFDYVYYEDSIKLSSGSNMVCYYDFTPETFYSGYIGTPEGFKAFKEAQDAEDCALYPFVQWGSSKADVEQFMQSRTDNPAPEGKMKVTDTRAYLEYSIAPGLSSEYVFKSKDATNLSSVRFTYKGGATSERVLNSMKKQGYKYLGSVQNYKTDFYYISPDRQTKFAIYQPDIILKLKGYESWSASFSPVTQEDIDKFGIN